MQCYFFAMSQKDNISVMFNCYLFIIYRIAINSKTQHKTYLLQSEAPITAGFPS